MSGVGDAANRHQHDINFNRDSVLGSKKDDHEKRIADSKGAGFQFQEQQNKVSAGIVSARGAIVTGAGGPGKQVNTEQ